MIPADPLVWRLYNSFVNDAGTKVIGTGSRLASGAYFNFSWIPGAPTAPDYPGLTYELIGASATCNEFVTLRISPGGDFISDFFTGNGTSTVTLPNIPGSFSQGASTMSKAGSVVVGTAYPVAGGLRGFYWTPTASTVALPNPTGNSLQTADGISRNGQFIVGAVGAFSSTQIFRFKISDGTTVFYDITGLEDSRPSVSHVSSDGTFVLGEAENPQGLRQPYLLSTTSAPINLNAYISSSFGTLLGPWQIDRIRDMSSDGKKFIGTARNPSIGKSSAFVLNLSGANVSGRLTLSDFSGSVAAETVTVKVRDAGGNVLETIPNVPLNAQGDYSFTSSQTGVRTIAFQGRTWLTKTVTNVNLGAGTVNNVNATLVNGDSTHDDVVDLSDYTIIVTAFNALPSSGNWDVRADLNGDGVVDLTDYTIVITNFNQTGE